MAKIQVDLDDNEDKIVEIYKAINNLKSKELAVKRIVMEKKELLNLK